MGIGTLVQGALANLSGGSTEIAQAPGAVARLARAVTPDLRADPRLALRDMRLTQPLQAALGAVLARAGITIENSVADDPYADAEGRLLQRHFSVLRSGADEVVLLQIPDWVANDGANVGALDEVRDVFSNRKVRIVADGVQAPSLSLDRTMPRLWRLRAGIDLEFVAWRYVSELVQGRLMSLQAFGLSDDEPPAVAARPVAARPKVRVVFIGSTGEDLHAYRERARTVCEQNGFMPLMMEHFEAMGLGATAGSLAKLDQADLYVGIFAHRYGFIEPGQASSVTELEFDHAAKMPRLCFLLDPDFPWPPKSWDAQHHAQLLAFKARIDRSLIRGRFTTEDNFAALLTQALVAQKP